MNTNVDNIHNSEKRFSALPRKKSVLRRWLPRIVLLSVGIYAGIVVLLLASETSLVYPGSKYPRGNWKPTNFTFEEIEFESGDGTKLFGWYLPKPEDDSELPNIDDQVQQPAEEDEPPQRTDTRTILLCHGNAENVAQASQHNGDYFRHALNANVFVFDYRGFGKSEGTPDEAGVLADSESAMQWLWMRVEKQPSEIILVGHSIGGGPAVHLASKFGCKALILQRTFSKLTDPAQNQYPWIPVSYLMRNQYPSTEKIATCNSPVFQSHGDSDRLIPIKFGRELFDASPAKKKVFFEVPGMTHWDALPANYWTELANFIAEIEAEN